MMKHSDSAPSDGGELHFLNRHHSFPLEAWQGETLNSERPLSALGRLKAALRSRVRRYLHGAVLAEYLQREQEYQANLVRLLNQWKREREELRALREQELHGIRHQLAVQAERLSIVESVVKGLERIVAVMGRPAPGSPSEPPKSAVSPQSASHDYSYLLLENRFRGSEEIIRERLDVYLPILSAAPGPVLEIGCGRGELLGLLTARGVLAYGVELDAAMVERSTAQGFDVRLENGIEHLRTLSPRSLGAIVAIQVLEHLPYPVLRELLDLARTRLVEGGMMIVETIDTSSLLALSQNYFRDPTHAAPLHPETLSYLFELSGLEVVEVKKLSPYPAGFELAKLPERAVGAGVEELAEVRRVLNENSEKLNRLLYGYQDYCIVARASGRPV